jgi:pilus assembly protein FimV
MFRKISLASAISLVLLPVSAGALDVGGIRTQSALNEPFAGQIDLLDAEPDALDTIKVLLAPMAEFNKAGAPRPQFLTQLRFSPELSSGRPVIRVSSADPIREPYLDFLIEVTWPDGRLVKEYTVLLDPPVTVDRAPAPVEQPVFEPPTSEPANLGEPVAAETPAQPAEPPSSTDDSAFPLRYGPVEPGAGLWRIARKMAPSAGAGFSQTAMALYRNNQNAFIRGDINKLKVGEVLQIPTSAELLALDEGAADREFKAALRGDSVTATPLTDVSAAPTPEDRLRIAGTAEPAPVSEAPPEAPPEVSPAGVSVAEGAPDVPTEGTVAPVEGVAAGETEPEIGTIKEDLLLVQEASESTRQETENLRNRIRELETRLADMQRLLVLSNERFAQLQTAGMEKPDAGDPEVTEEPAAATRGETGPALGKGEGVQEAVEPAAEAEPAATSPPPTEAVAEVAEDEAAPSPEPAAAPGFLESVPRPVLLSALAVPLLLLLLGWMIKRRRKSLEESLKPGDLTPEAPSSATAGAASAATASAEQESDSAAASEPTLSPYSGFGNLDDETEEADIISEADVYIAYGRYREAESLLEEEVDKSPDRLDIKYKLAEAYYGARNLQGMEALMEQMQGAGGAQLDPDRWKRLEIMMRDLKGGDADDRGPAISGDAQTIPAASASALSEEAKRSPPVQLAEMPEPAGSGAGLTDSGDVLKVVPPVIDSHAPPSGDLALDVEDLEVTGGATAPPRSEEAIEMSGSASDLELQLDDLEGLRELDLAGLSKQEKPASEPPPAETLTAVPAEPVGDSVDIAPVGKDSLASGVLSSQWQMDSGLWDEVATKIDLARAYMEMEDPEAARVILEEVAQEGNENQRAEAKEMMARLG